MSSSDSLEEEGEGEFDFFFPPLCSYETAGKQRFNLIDTMNTV